MMSDWLYFSLLSIIQGLTEFLPISSSAHLILFPILVDHSDQGLAFDVSVHCGTLLAVLYYFRKKIKWLWFGFLKSLQPNRTKPLGHYSLLSWWLIFASIPIAIAGALLHHLIEEFARSPIVIACTTIIFGLVLLFADHFSTKQKSLSSLNLPRALFVGILQIFALIPGTSRSGITLTGGLFLGLNRQSAATFSFLLAIPAILMAGGYESLKLLHVSNQLAWPYFVLGFTLSAVTAFWCIHFFLKLINKLGLLPFVAYRMVLGASLLLIFYS